VKGLGCGKGLRCGMYLEIYNLNPFEGFRLWEGPFEGFRLWEGFKVRDVFRNIQPKPF